MRQKVRSSGKAREFMIFSAGIKSWQQIEFWLKLKSNAQF